MIKIKGITSSFNELKTIFFNHVIYDDGRSCSFEATDFFKKFSDGDSLVWLSDVEKEFVNKSVVDRDYVLKSEVEKLLK